MSYQIDENLLVFLRSKFPELKLDLVTEFHHSGKTLSYILINGTKKTVSWDSSITIDLSTSDDPTRREVARDVRKILRDKLTEEIQTLTT